MTFRRDQSFFVTGVILLSSFILLYLAMIPVFGFTVCLVIVLILGWILYGLPRYFNEFISIDNSGISCEKAGNVLWAYEWNQVVGLRKCSRFFQPAIRLVLDERGEKRLHDPMMICFQLSKRAKQALTRYLPKEVTLE